jgi:hypothetical protein
MTIGEVMMSHNEPFCPYPHKGHVRTKVLALQISDRQPYLRIGGVRLSPRVVHGVDVHCPTCHCESWVEMVAGWDLTSWDGPKRCSCGEMARNQQ